MTKGPSAVGGGERGGVGVGLYGENIVSMYAAYGKNVINDVHRRKNARFRGQKNMFNKSSPTGPMTE